MNRPAGNGPNEDTPPEERPASIVVPGPQALADDGAATEEQMVRDLGSASRSCVAIIVVLLLMALVLCVFLLWAFVQ